MPVSKLKNLALLILLLANLALLAVVVPNEVSQRQEAARQRQFLQALYAQEDVTLDPDSVPETVTLYTLQLEENPEADLLAATALLGEQVLVQDDSTRYLSIYRSQNGTCSIGRSGSFQAALEQQPEVRSIGPATERVLKDMGFQWHALSEPQRIRPGVYTVSTAQSILGVPVFSRGLTLTWSNNTLHHLEGDFFTGTASMARVSDQACISAADALVRFLSARFELGWMGSTVVGMEQGYLRSETAAAATVQLTPVWRLDTDTGSFYVNGISGEVTAA